MNDNCIVIDGIKHVLVPDTKNGCDCCSLETICNYCGKFMCNDLFDKSNSHFEIQN